MTSSRKFLVFLLAVLVLSVSACRPADTSSSDDSAQNGHSGSSSDLQSQSDGTGSSPGTAQLTVYEFEPEETGIFITRDGLVRSAEITSFDNSRFAKKRYDEKGLQEFVENTIREYNDAKGVEAVKLEEISVKDKKARLVLSYASVNFFLDFQGLDFGVRSLSVLPRDTAIRNYDIYDLVDPYGNTVDLMDALHMDDLKIIVVSGNVSIALEGDISYLSSGMVVTGKNSARCVDDQHYSFILFR